MWTVVAYRILKGAVILLVVWYVTFGAFAFFYPYCHAGEEPIFGVCYLGNENYGGLYTYLCWIFFFWAIPVDAVILWLLIYARQLSQAAQAV